MCSKASQHTKNRFSDYFRRFNFEPNASPKPTQYLTANTQSTLHGLIMYQRVLSPLEMPHSQSYSKFRDSGYDEHFQVAKHVLHPFRNTLMYFIQVAFLVRLSVEKVEFGLNTLKPLENKCVRKNARLSPSFHTHKDVIKPDLTEGLPPTFTVQF